MLWTTRLVATLLFLTAAFGTFLAATVHYALCRDGNHPSCPEGARRAWELDWGVVLAGLGVAAAAAMLYFAWRERYRLTAVLLAVALLLYAGCVVLLDVATHDGDFTLL